MWNCGKKFAIVFALNAIYCTQSTSHGSFRQRSSLNHLSEKTSSIPVQSYILNAKISFQHFCHNFVPKVPRKSRKSSNRYGFSQYTYRFNVPLGFFFFRHESAVTRGSEIKVKPWTILCDSCRWFEEPSVQSRLRYGGSLQSLSGFQRRLYCVTALEFHAPSRSWMAFCAACLSVAKTVQVIEFFKNLWDSRVERSSVVGGSQLRMGTIRWNRPV